MDLRNRNEQVDRRCSAKQTMDDGEPIVGVRMTPMKLQAYLEGFEKSLKHTQDLISLIEAARVIRIKLHRSKGITVEMEERSKNTRRNAQYRTMACNQIHFLANAAIGNAAFTDSGYMLEPCVYEGNNKYVPAEPRLAHFARELESDKVLRIDDESKRFKVVSSKMLEIGDIVKHPIHRTLYCSKKKDSYTKYVTAYTNSGGLPAMKVEPDSDSSSPPPPPIVIPGRRIKRSSTMIAAGIEPEIVGGTTGNSKNGVSPSTSSKSKKGKETAEEKRRRVWTLEMAEYLIDNMGIFVKFAYSRYLKHGKDYEDFQSNCTKLLKSRGGKKCDPPAQGAPHEEWQQYFYETLMRNDRKISGILSKLYMAMLLELDLEVFLNMRINAEPNPCDFRDCDIRLFHAIIIELVNKKYSKLAAPVHEDELRSMVKEAHYSSVLEELRVLAIEVKYHKFSCSDRDLKQFQLYSLREFAVKSCHNECIEYFVSPTQLHPQYQPDGNATLVTVSDNGSLYIYDAIMLPNKSTYELSQLTWSERLAEAAKYVDSLPESTNPYKQYKIISVDWISQLKIQFLQLPPPVGAYSTTYYYYFSTRGLGRGTNFIHMISADRKNKNPTPNPRQKRPKHQSNIASEQRAYPRQYQDYGDELVNLSTMMSRRIASNRACNAVKLKRNASSIAASSFGLRELAIEPPVKMNKIGNMSDDEPLSLRRALTPQPSAGGSSSSLSSTTSVIQSTGIPAAPIANTVVSATLNSVITSTAAVAAAAAAATAAADNAAAANTEVPSKRQCRNVNFVNCI